MADLAINPVAGKRKGVSICLFSVPGAGKTRLIGTGPKTLIVRPPTDHTESIVLPADVDEFEVQGHSDMSEIFQHLHQGGHKAYDWVWLDSATLFEDTGLADVFEDAVARKQERAEFGPDKGEYGINRGRIMQWVRDMVGLAGTGKINFGVTAHPMEWWDPVNEEQVWVPMVGSVEKGNLSAKLCGYMNIVAYLKVVRRKDKPTRRLLMTDAEGFYGKDQITSGQLNKMVDPTMPKIISALNKSRRPARRRTTRRREQRSNG